MLLNLGDKLLRTCGTFLIFTSKTAAPSCTLHAGAIKNQNEVCIFSIWLKSTPHKSQNKTSQWQQARKKKLRALRVAQTVSLNKWKLAYISSLHANHHFVLLVLVFFSFSISFLFKVCMKVVGITLQLKRHRHKTVWVSNFLNTKKIFFDLFRLLKIIILSSILLELLENYFVHLFNRKT